MSIKTVRVFFIALGLGFLPVSSFAQEVLPSQPPAETASETPAETPDETKGVSLYQCKDEKFGVKFLCNPNWEIQTREGTMFVIISSAPPVTMTVAINELALPSLEQLTRDNLKAIGQYRDGFTIESVKIADRDAVHVVGTPEESRQTKLYDYYFLNNTQLYGLLFSVYPSERWKDYETLIFTVRDSFAFLNDKDVSSESP